MRSPILRHAAQIALLIGSAFLLAACEFPGQKTYAGFDVKMTDSGSGQVYLDDLHLGQTPIRKNDIKPGTYTFRIEPNEAGKQPYQTQVHLYPGTLTSVLWGFHSTDASGSGEVFELEPLASKDRSELSVITLPEGGKVSLGDKSYGLSPVVADDVTPGSYELTLEAVAHEKKTVTINLTAGYRLHVFSRLATNEEALGTTGDSSTPAATGNSALFPSPSPSASPSSTDVTNPTTPGATGTVAKPYVSIRTTETGWLRVRSEASSAGTEVAKANSGEKYPYKSTLDGWFEIEYTPGKTGWISGQYADVVR